MDCRSVNGREERSAGAAHLMQHPPEKRGTAITSRTTYLLRALFCLMVGGLIVIGTAFSGPAFAQSPGPMSRGHAELDGAVDCNKCHAAGYGVPNDKCLSCHTHQPLRRRIQAGRGFHASEDVKGKECRSCHPEHIEEPPGSGRGRRTLVDWKPFGGKRNFDHDLAGWPLEGQHRYQKCEKCHTDKYPKSKLRSYLGQRQECTTCHFGTPKESGPGGENPHRFTDVGLTDCRICHDFSGWRINSLKATQFDHSKTDYPISGFHTERRCVGCHKDLSKFEVEEDSSDCIGCHEDSHRSVVSHERACSSCHTMEVKFRKTIYDHGKESGWPLRGKHRRNRCQDCHKIDSPPKAPNKACVTCHKDVHKKRFEPEACEGCHVEQSFKRMVYDHGAKTKFELTGKHETAACGDCHRFGIGPKFEKFKSNECADCHRHLAAHCGQFGREGCERCHVQGGDRTSKFDHSVTRFPLERAHSDVDCQRCHKPAQLGRGPACREAVKYTGLEPGCFACHIDVHEGSLGDDCAKCHSGGASFDLVVFDHNRDSQFPLTGFHQVVSCDACHPQRKFKLGESRCVSCHSDDDVHGLALGDDCARCHETTGGAPKFEHNVHTQFDLEGTHARIECARCHFLNEDGTSPVEHKTGASSPLDYLASWAQPGAPIDLQFRTSGQACEDCHLDPHKVRDAPIDCGSCHGAENWQNPPRNGYHELVGLSLSGAHSVLACQLCHEGNGSLQGRAERCGSCHVQDDIHAGSLGFDCARCHEQNYWLPSSFNHSTVGFVLEGVHRMLDCRSCHQAGNYFIGRQCLNCHLRDYRVSIWHTGDRGVDDLFGQADRHTINGLFVDPNTNIAQSFDCGRCHNQFTFFGAFGEPQ